MKVLIIRFSSIGDVILTSPIVRCVKKQKKAEVHYLTKKSMATLLENNPYIDRVHLFKDNKAELKSLLKKEGFDLIIDLHNNLRSRSFMSGLKGEKYSFYKANVEKWMKVNLKLDALPSEHLVDRYFKGILSTGIKNDGMGLDCFISDKAQLEAIKQTKTLGNYVVLSLGATYFTKRIPLDKWSSWIQDNNEIPFVLVGGNDVKEISDALENKFAHRVLNLCGKISLQCTAAIIKNASSLITGDTGTMHMGAAFRIPMINIWGSTIRDFGMFPYYGMKEKMNIDLEVSGLSCRPCSKLGYGSCPKKHFKCMLDIDDARLKDELSRQIQPKN